jgi:hypothetical protein
MNFKWMFFFGISTGHKFFKVYQNLVIASPFFVFFPCKDTFMDDHDGIYNYNNIKYSVFEIFNNFLFIIFYGDQNIG